MLQYPSKPLTTSKIQCGHLGQDWLSKKPAVKAPDQIREGQFSYH